MGVDDLGVEEDGDGLGGASARSTRGEGREGGEVRGGGEGEAGKEEGDERSGTKRESVIAREEF